jgi:hypothetical protein
MGGGREMFTLISISAIVVIGATSASARSIAPKINIFILLPPSILAKGITNICIPIN